MRSLFFMALCLLFLCKWGKGASDTLVLRDNGFSQIEVNASASLFTDSSGSLTIEDILRGEGNFQTGFEQQQQTIYPTAHWLKIHLKAEKAINNRWFLFTSDVVGIKSLSFINYADAYYLKDGKLLSHHRSGYYVPKNEKSIPERAGVVAFPFSLEAGESRTIYFRLSSATDQFNTPLSVELTHPIPHLSDTTGGHAWVVFGSQAMYSLIGLYVLFFWLLVKDPSYLYFGIFCLLFSTHYINIEPVSGFIDRFFPNAPHRSKILGLLASGSYTFFLLFGRSFSEVRTRLARWDRYLLLVVILYSFYFAYLVLNSISEPYSYSSNFGIFVVFFLILPISIKFLLGKHLYAKIFGIGVITFFFWNSMGLLWNLGIISLPFNPWPVGQIGFLIIFGVGLAYKFFHSEREKVQAERIRELDSIKSRFFANISHEFRTPLSLILGPINQSMESIPASETISDNDEVPVRGKHLKVVKRNALRLQSLVDQLLDLSKLDNGKMKLTVSEGKIIQFMRSIVFSFESLAERQHIHFNTSFPAEPETAYFDPDKLEKILVNLLSNAFKFTPEHGTIRVIVEEQKNRLKIQVGDSGPGMSAEEIDKVFDRFYQVEGTEDKGTGIGLALVRELVNLHGGQISVDSMVGEGTNFKVTIPYRSQDFSAETIFLEKPQKETSSNMLSAIYEDTQASSNGQSTSSEDHPLALVVEDNPDLRYYIEDNIRANYRVIIARDGQEGLMLATEQIPDIIISDVMMPRKSGFELCQELKTDQRTSHIPIILLTAKVGQDHKIAGLEQGADDYLTKPFDVRELNIRMSNLIEQRQRLREKYSGELKIRPSEISLSSVDEQFMISVMEEIEKNMGNEYFTVEELARSVRFSRSQLHRKLKALTNKSANQLIREFRLTRAKEMLEQNAASVSEIAFEVGYSNLSYFSKSYKETFGKLPSEHK